MSKQDDILDLVLVKHPTAKQTLASLIEAADRHLRPEFALQDVNELRALQSTERALTCRRGAKYMERVAMHMLDLGVITVATENTVMQSLWVALAVREAVIVSLQAKRNRELTLDIQQGNRPINEAMIGLNPHKEQT